jgi:hypothetical protein
VLALLWVKDWGIATDGTDPRVLCVLLVKHWSDCVIPFNNHSTIPVTGPSPSYCREIDLILPNMSCSNRSLGFGYNGSARMPRGTMTIVTMKIVLTYTTRLQQVTFMRFFGLG